MKYKLNVPLKELDGSDVVGQNKQVVTVAHQCVLALCVQEEIDGMEKMRRGELAEKIFKAKDEVEFTIEDVALVKQLVGKYLSTVAVMQIWRLLEKG